MISFFLCLFLTVPAWASPLRFRQVAPGLYRSGLASSAQDYEDFRRHGVKTIVDLRDGPDIEEERATANRLGFRYVNIPLNVRSTVTDYVRAERAFFQIVDTHEGSLVFHCKHGKDRTGLMAALYRVKRQGWSPEDAIAEWKSLGGFGPDWGTGIQAYFVARVRMAQPLICSDFFSHR